MNRWIFVLILISVPHQGWSKSINSLALCQSKTTEITAEAQLAVKTSPCQQIPHYINLNDTAHEITLPPTVFIDNEHTDIKQNMSTTSWLYYSRAALFYFLTIIILYLVYLLIPTFKYRKVNNSNKN